MYNVHLQIQYVTDNKSSLIITTIFYLYCRKFTKERNLSNTNVVLFQFADAIYERTRLTLRLLMFTEMQEIPFSFRKYVQYIHIE